MPDNKTRIDKWLWSVRIFKSRTLASEACRSGRVKKGETALKPSYLVSPEELISVRKGGYSFEFKVIKIISKRVGAELARPCYENLTSEDELNKYNTWFVGKASAEKREKGAGRPTKRDRRELEDFKEDRFNFDEL